jgi:hypothetical protein
MARRQCASVNHQPAISSGPCHRAGFERLAHIIRSADSNGYVVQTQHTPWSRPNQKRSNTRLCLHIFSTHLRQRHSLFVCLTVFITVCRVPDAIHTSSKGGCGLARSFGKLPCWYKWQVVMSVIPNVLQNHVSFSRYLRICLAALRSCILIQIRPLHNPQLISSFVST